MRYGDDLLEIRDIVSGVSNTFDEDGLGLVVDGCFEVLCFIAVYELGLDAETGKEDFELVVCASISSTVSQNPQSIQLEYHLTNSK